MDEDDFGDFQNLSDSVDVENMLGSDSAMEDLYGDSYESTSEDFSGDSFDLDSPDDEQAGLTQEQLGRGIVQETLGQQITEQASADFAAQSVDSPFGFLNSFLNPLRTSAAGLLPTINRYTGQAGQDLAHLVSYGGSPMTPYSMNVGLPMVAPGRAVTAYSALMSMLRARFPGITWSRISSAMRTFGPAATAAVLGISAEMLMQLAMRKRTRRGRGISYRDIRCTKRTITKLSRMNSMLRSFMGGGGGHRRSYSFRRAKKCR